ncbi:unnamed protein product [Rotaria magnacalcarata]|uniref:Uncharacterized protein n=1 Tax=Rotaria magnacalcarata TaxID=392030 RepID=A0A8S3DGQ0_9BILA|nr:unnamed protein product [Rotaria magnacalcarata]
MERGDHVCQRGGISRGFMERGDYVYHRGRISRGFLQPLAVLLSGEFQYDNYHCQIHLTGWRDTSMGALLIWLLPLSLTVIIYGYTFCCIRQNSVNFTSK